MKTLRVPLVGGMEQSIDKRIMPEGAIYRAENVYYSKTGRLEKRHGWGAEMGTDYLGEIQQVARVGNAVVVEHSTSGLLSAFLNEETKVAMGRASVLPGFSTVQLGIASGDRVAVASNATTVLVVWHNEVAATGTPAGLYYAAIDKKTNTVIAGPTRIAGVDGEFHVLDYDEQNFVLVWDTGSTTNDVLAYVLNAPSFAVNPSAPIITDRASGFGHGASIQRDAGRLLIAYRDTSNDIALVEFVVTTSGVSVLGSPITMSPTGLPTNIEVAHTAYTLGGYDAFITFDDSVSGASYVQYLANSAIFGSQRVIDASGARPFPCTAPGRGTYGLEIVWRVSSGVYGIQHGYPATSAPYMSGVSSSYYQFEHMCAFSHRGRLHAVGKEYSVVSNNNDVVVVDLSDGLVPVARFGRDVGKTLVRADGAPLRVAADPGGLALAIPNIIKTAGSVSDDSPVAVVVHVAEENRHQRSISGVGDVGVVAGNLLVVADGQYNPEVGFLSAPTPFTVLASTSATGLAARTYAYRLTYEAVDWKGRRHQSPPGDVVTVYSTSSVSFAVLAPITRRASGVNIVVWRNNQLGGNIYYRAMSYQLDNDWQQGYASFTDNATDGAISTNETLYTSQGRLAWISPTGSKRITEHNQRLWVAEGEKLHFSNVLGGVVPDDALTFYEEGYVLLTDEVVALGSMDNFVIALCAESIFAVGGDGPQETGDGSFNSPWQLQTRIGCSEALGGQRSVARTPKGLVYRSPFGIALLMYGWQVRHISERVSDELETYPYVLDVAVDVESGLVRFVCAASNETGASAVALVWNYEEPEELGDVWTVETLPKGAVALIQSGTTSLLGTDDVSAAGTNYSRLYVERASSLGDHTVRDGTQHIQTQLTMGRFYPGGIGGWGRAVRSVWQGEYQGTCNVRVEYSYNDGASWDGATYSTALDASTGDIQLMSFLPRQRCNNVVVRMTESATSPSGGMVWNAMSLEYEPLDGMNRITGVRRIG